jgi:hypothetical protein
MNHLKAKLLTAALATALSASAYAVQGSKFAAHVAQPGSGMQLMQKGVNDTTDLLTTTISTANYKDLLIGVSLQSGLYTDTKVKGKNGSYEEAGAEAAIKVHVDITGEDSYGNPAKVYPQEVVFAGRVQELSAVLGGVINSCSDSNEDGTITVVDECDVGDEEIGLMLSTTSANHFNFVAPDLAPGDHTVTVQVTSLSSAEFTNGTYSSSNMSELECTDAGGAFNAATGECTFTTTDNEASSWAMVDVGSLTVEEVRAVNVVDQNATNLSIDLDAGY